MASGAATAVERRVQRHDPRDTAFGRLMDFQTVVDVGAAAASESDSFPKPETSNERKKRT